METIDIEQKAYNIGISKDLIIREKWEMILLQELAESNIGNRLVFKGGTLLRLGYGSSRFSEDLDFDLKNKISTKEFKNAVEKIVNRFGEMKGDKNLMRRVQLLRASGTGEAVSTLSSGPELRQLAKWRILRTSNRVCTARR